MSNFLQEDRIVKRIVEHRDSLDDGLKILGIFLQGSQNYKLDTEDSDIDTKAIVLPSFEDFALNKKPKSITCNMDNKEQCDVKDIRVMFNNFRKQNINFVEILFSSSKIIENKYLNEFEPMLERREEIARYDEASALRCMKGMAYQKRKALKHLYPSTIEKIEKFGYDPKQLHHIIRMVQFADKYTLGLPYSECLIPDNIDELIAIKKGEMYTKHQVEEVADKAIEYLCVIIDEYIEKKQPKVNNDVEEFMNDVLIKIMKKSFIEDIKK